MALVIRKQTTSVWTHEKNGNPIILSKFYFRISGSGTSESFEITEPNGVDQFTGAAKRTLISDITLFDDSTGGGVEVFASGILLSERLEALLYPGFKSASGGSGAIISDEVYGASWENDTLNGASKNALFDKIESIPGGGAGLPPATDTGTIVDLSNYNGTYAYMSAASSEELLTFNDGTKVLGGTYFRLFKTANQPRITGATKVSEGAAFISDTEMYLVARYNGNRVEYRYEEITADLSQFVGLPYGVIITESLLPAVDYYASPCILKTTTDRTFVSHDIFGSGLLDKKTRIYFNDDIINNTWTLSAEFDDFIWGTLFEYSGDVYILGVTDYPTGGEIVISKTTDDGVTWSTPATMLTIPLTYSGWTTAPINPIIKDGFFVKAFELRDDPFVWAEGHNSVLVFCDLADLTDSANWSYSNIVPFDGAAFAATGIWTDTAYTKRPDGTGSATKGFLEGNLVEKFDDDLIVVLRLEQNPSANHAVYLDVTWNSGSPELSTISTTLNFIDMPGGNVKFQIIKDDISSKHWTITNLNRSRWFGDGRIEAFLMSSDDDCVTWTVHEKILGYALDNDWETNIPALGVQYNHFITVGNDLLTVDRTANEDANDWHNANAITLTAVVDFRNSPVQARVNGSLIIDENSTRVEDIWGIALMEDQSSYYNTPFMLTADNINKVNWVDGMEFKGDEWLRVMHSEGLNPDVNDGFTIYIVMEDIQNIGGFRILSKSDGGSDTLSNNWLYAPSLGLGVQNSRGAYSDLTLTNDYIFASSFDNVDEDIYNFLNGANRGVPDTVTDGTWNTDRIEIGTAYTSGNIGELGVGARLAGSSIPCEGLIKAVHIIPNYTTPVNVIAYMDALNAIYSIY